MLQSADGGAGADQSAEQLAHIVRVELFAESSCPGEQQSLLLIEKATDGYDPTVIASALRMMSVDAENYCAAVGASLERARNAAELAVAARQSAEGDPNVLALTTVGGEGPPGEGGGPGYLIDGS
ncbi:MAG: hypothetical protein AB7O04_08660 [Hyphomonadaceae bacterium]